MGNIELGEDKKEELVPIQTRSMPRRVLSSNVDSSKAKYATVLLSIAPDCECCNALYGGFSFEEGELKLMEMGENPFGSWIQSSGILAKSRAILSKFWRGLRQNQVRQGREE